jgi:hypothetical protein
MTTNGYEDEYNLAAYPVASMMQPEITTNEKIHLCSTINSDRWKIPKRIHKIRRTTFGVKDGRYPYLESEIGQSAVSQPTGWKTLLANWATTKGSGWLMGLVGETTKEGETEAEKPAGTDEKEAKTGEKADSTPGRVSDPQAKRRKKMVSKASIMSLLTRRGGEGDGRQRRFVSLKGSSGLSQQRKSFTMSLYAVLESTQREEKHQS